MRLPLHAISAALAAVAIVGGQVTTSADAGVAATCVGDCGEDSVVTLADVLLGIRIALGTESESLCPAADSSHDNRVTVDELVRAVLAAHGECPVKATATITPTLL